MEEFQVLIIFYLILFFLFKFRFAKPRESRHAGCERVFQALFRLPGPSGSLENKSFNDFFCRQELLLRFCSVWHFVCQSFKV